MTGEMHESEVPLTGRMVDETLFNTDHAEWRRQTRSRIRHLMEWYNMGMSLPRVHRDNHNRWLSSAL